MAFGVSPLTRRLDKSLIVLTSGFADLLVIVVMVVVLVLLVVVVKMMVVVMIVVIKT